MKKIFIFQNDNDRESKHASFESDCKKIAR